MVGMIDIECASGGESPAGEGWETVQRAWGLCLTLVVAGVSFSPFKTISLQD